MKPIFYRIVALLPFLLLSASVSAYTRLSDDFLRLIPSAGDDLDILNGKLLAPLLIPRVSGTTGSLKVQEHFVNFFKTELPKWSVEWHNSTSKTPVSGNKEVPFKNLIFKREPPWVKIGQSNLLTLVAHYDSKYAPHDFIGATDSAVPCAILIHVARSVDKYMTQMHDEMDALGEGGTVEMDMGIQILLLDGEEAFVDWTATDSLYGARALAQTWEHTVHPAMAKYANPLEQISLFLLLDLLGAPNPRIPSYFLNTHWAYKNMATVEDRMRQLGLLEATPNIPFLPESNKQSSRFTRSGVEDDHIPFMKGGVPVLHIIPLPFPDVWHNMRGIPDDGEHLDMPTVRDWAKIVTAFAFEWLDMMEVAPQAA